jgi:hypothetical protein
MQGEGVDFHATKYKPGWSSPPKPGMPLSKTSEFFENSDVCCLESTLKG